MLFSIIGANKKVLVTGPYFHDGSQETLWDVMDHYNKGDGLQDPYLDEDIQPLALTEDDIDDVVAFLASLTSADYRAQGIKELARPPPGPRPAGPPGSTRSGSSPTRCAISTSGGSPWTSLLQSRPA